MGDEVILVDLWCEVCSDGFLSQLGFIVGRVMRRLDYLCRFDVSSWIVFILCWILLLDRICPAQFEVYGFGCIWLGFAHFISMETGFEKNVFSSCAGFKPDGGSLSWMIPR